MIGGRRLQSWDYRLPSFWFLNLIVGITGSMASIGERLAEARKRGGISIKDAATATKIRGEYLLSFENNRFDIDLPEVYRRGFLKNYARYLKLDPDKVAEDYQALQQAPGKATRRGEPTRENFGRVEVPESQPTIGSREAVPPGDRYRRNEGGPADPLVGSGGRGNGMRIAVATALILLGVGGLFWGIHAILNHNSGRVSPSGESSVAASPTLTIRALGDISNLVVRRVSDRTNLFVGSLAMGQKQTVPLDGEVDIRSTNVELIEVLIGDRSWKLSGTGLGRATFGPSGPVN